MSHTTDKNNFVDLLGSAAASPDNPYDLMIQACVNDTKQIQKRYEMHRKTRNEQQKARMLSTDFTGDIIDPVLKKLVDQNADPGYVDPRNCLVFWARPPQRIRDLVSHIQARLLESAPNIWLMPTEHLHMTVMEVTHSQTEETISRLVDVMDSKIPEIADFTYNHRAQLLSPMVNFDTAAIALSFLPAADEKFLDSSDPKACAYTYHHLRRDMYARCKDAGVEIESRYVVPSSHLTIARFVTREDFTNDWNEDINHSKVEALVAKVEAINEGLSKQTAIWQIGEEKGLVCRRGTVWYGGGYSQHEGRGFSNPHS